MMKMMIITYGNRLTYSSKPVWSDDEFALVSSDAEFPISVVLPTLNLQIHTMFAHTIMPFTCRQITVFVNSLTEVVTRGGN